MHLYGIEPPSLFYPRPVPCNAGRSGLRSGLPGRTTLAPIRSFFRFQVMKQSGGSRTFMSAFSFWPIFQAILQALMMWLKSWAGSACR
mgnify:CR=1 FL=1